MKAAKEVFPLISIITPSFNQGEFIEECIDSVLCQNYPNLEYIIMDGGSSDNSLEIIKKYEKYLAYWQSKPDGGQYNAVNEGFKKTSGTIMTWLNSDDKYHRDAFYKVACIFSQIAGAEWITGHPTFWGKEGAFTHLEHYLPTYCRKDFLEGRYNQPFIQQESTFWKRSLWNRAGGYLRADLDYAGDLELWIRFFRHALLYSVETFFGGYRSHGNQKAGLHMDDYVVEAGMILSEELKLNSESFAAMFPEAPTPVKLNPDSYRKYLKSRDEKLYCSSQSMATGEEVLQYLLHKFNLLQVEATRQNVLADHSIDKNHEIVQLRSSLSWRLTKPLRWLSDKIK